MFPRLLQSSRAMADLRRVVTVVGRRVHFFFYCIGLLCLVCNLEFLRSKFRNL